MKLEKQLTHKILVLLAHGNIYFNSSTICVQRKMNYQYTKKIIKINLILAEILTLNTENLLSNQMLYACNTI